MLLDISRAGNRIVAVGERGHVLISKDDGVTWRQIQVPTRAMLTAVDFLDDKTGFAVGHDAAILRTSDAGESWQRVYSAPEAERPLFDILIVDRDRVIAVGAYGYYLESNDAGTTWQSRELRPRPLGQGAQDPGGPDNEDLADDFHLNAIVAAGPKRWYMAAEAGTIYRSDDAGRSWLRLPSPYEGSFFGVVPVAADEIVLFGLQGRVYKSKDGGVAWQRVDTGTRATLVDGVRLRNGRVVLVGLAGTILLGNELGSRFELRQQADRRGISAALVLENHILLAGEGGFRRVPINELLGGS